MENYNLTQTGQEVQEILDNATPQSELTTETQRAQLAEQTLQTHIDNETLTRENADTLLQTNIGAEETRAKAAEKQNADDIDALEALLPSGVSQSNKLVAQQALEAIIALIPSAASALNKLADKAFVNSSIATNTATFRGTFNLVSDLHLPIDANHETIALNLLTVTPTADNNDFCYVQIPDSAETPTVIASTDRYKFNGTEWNFEYTLNTSGFTSAQWDAINSGITAAILESLTGIPALIPSEATDQNQLADKAYVLTQILLATPAFKGQFTTFTQLQDVTGAKAGDLGIVRTKDTDGHDVFAFYQYKNDQWTYFYSLSYHPQDKPATTGLVGEAPYNGMGRVELPMNWVDGWPNDTWLYYPYNDVVYLMYYWNGLLYAPYNSGTQEGLGLDDNLVVKPLDYNIADIEQFVGQRYLPFTESSGVWTITKPDDSTITSTELNNTNIYKINDPTHHGINVLTQAMINRPNTIYVIQHDFTLGEDITVPANCILEFDGGSISGEHTLTGTNTGINAGLVKIFGTDVTLAGTWDVFEAYPEWFGAVGNGTIDDAISINKAVQSVFDRVVFSDKIYAINDTITLTHSITLIGKEGYTKFYNLKKNSIAAILADSVNNIILDGFEIDFNADIETMSSNVLCFRNGIVDFKNCNYSVIRNCKIYNVRYNMSNIIFQGDFNEVDHCEVYTGSGNRATSGIVMGWINIAIPERNVGAGSNYSQVHDCYVHDISIGSGEAVDEDQNESGYAIHLLCCTYSSAYNNTIVNPNWVGINGQAEGRLPDSAHIKVYGNTITINSVRVHPKQSYFGPFHVYGERTKSFEVYDNVLNVGVCNPKNKRYIPVMISDGCDNSVVRDNKILKCGVDDDVFFLDGTDGIPDVYSTYGIDDSCVLDGNYCDFAGRAAVFLYNSTHIDLTIRNQNLFSDGSFACLNTFGASWPENGNISIEHCFIKSNRFMIANPSFNTKINIIDCVFDLQGHSGDDGIFAYYCKDTLCIENCVFNNLNEPLLYINYGKGNIRFVNNIVNTLPTCGSAIVKGIGGEDYSDSYSFDIIGNTFNCGVECNSIQLPQAPIDHLNILDNIFKYATPAENSVSRIVYVGNNSNQHVGKCIISGNIADVSNVATFVVFNSYTLLEKAVMTKNVLLGFTSRVDIGNNLTGQVMSESNIGNTSNTSHAGSSYPLVKNDSERTFPFIRTDYGNRIAFWNGESWQDADGFPMAKNRGTVSEIPNNPGDGAIGSHFFLTDRKRTINWTSQGWLDESGLFGIGEKHRNLTDLPNSPYSLKGATIFVDDLDKPVYWNGSVWVTADGFTAAPTKGATANRPKYIDETGGYLHDFDIGYRYFDTDLNKPIWVKSLNPLGVVWVDATGATV